MKFNGCSRKGTIVPMKRKTLRSKFPTLKYIKLYLSANLLKSPKLIGKRVLKQTVSDSVPTEERVAGYVNNLFLFFLNIMKQNEIQKIWCWSKKTLGRTILLK